MAAWTGHRRTDGRTDRMADWERKDGRDQETVRRVEIRGMREAEGWGNRRLD